jgi:hypothetical protein
MAEIRPTQTEAVEVPVPVPVQEEGGVATPPATPRSKKSWDGMQNDVQSYVVAHAHDDKEAQQITKRLQTMTFGKIRHTKRCNYPVPWLPIDPSHPRRIQWDYVMAISVIILVMVGPFKIAFYEDLEVNARVLVDAIDSVIDIVFVTDIVVNFLTAYVTKDNEHITSCEDIARNYVTGWFLIDLLSSIPFHLLLGESSVDVSRLPRMLRFLRMVRLIRLLKIRRLQRLIDDLDEASVATTGLKIFMYMLAMYMASHVMACIWYFIASYDDLDHTTWAFQFELRDKSISEKYTLCWYWAIVTVTTVGYGDVTPVTTVEYLYSAVCSFLGSVGFAFLVGKMSALAAASESTNLKYKEKKEAVTAFMKFRNFPLGLRKDIRSFYDTKHSRGDFFDEDEIMNELSYELRKKVAKYMNKEALTGVPFFRDCSNALLDDLLLRLRICYASGGDIIIAVNDLGQEMYILHRGEVSVISAENHILATLGEGSFFGEIALLKKNLRRTVTIKAMTTCILYKLTKNDLEQVFVKYPSFKAEMQLIADNRLRQSSRDSKFARAERRKSLEGEFDDMEYEGGSQKGRGEELGKGKGLRQKLKKLWPGFRRD